MIGPWGVTQFPSAPPPRATRVACGALIMVPSPYPDPNCLRPHPPVDVLTRVRLTNRAHKHNVTNLHECKRDFIDPFP